MAFGDAKGPPAMKRQLDELLALLQDAGHTDFRDARGPMQFTSRQAAGRFTRDEAAAFIDQLQAAADEAEERADAGAAPALPSAGAERLTATEQQLRRMPAEQLGAELQRRGWIVMEP
jgi:hypothetical protein